MIKVVPYEKRLIAQEVEEEDCVEISNRPQ